MNLRKRPDALLTLPCFRHLEGRERSVLYANIDTVLTAGGESFWAATQTGSEVILVIQGELTTTGQQPRAFRPGMIAGVLAMLDPTRCPYVVRVVRPSRLGFLSQRQLEAAMSGSPAFRGLVGTALIDDLHDDASRRTRRCLSKSSTGMRSAAVTAALPEW